jgi:RimJ/RimL family protein N-acetyltransferase
LAYCLFAFDILNTQSVLRFILVRKTGLLDYGRCLWQRAKQTVPLHSGRFWVYFFMIMECIFSEQLEKRGLAFSGGVIMEIETDRLLVKLLTLPQLKLWVNSISVLENDLHCTYDAEPIEGEFKNIINGQIQIIEKEPENVVYLSFWFIIRKHDRIVVGSMDFKNVPNEENEVEIGYGLGKKYEHHGYMTEAVKGFCEFAFKNPEIKKIIAETETAASQNVLKRNGFAKYKEGEMSWWKLVGKKIMRYDSITQTDPSRAHD